MEITEVRIKLMEDSEDRLLAFCSITFDHCFVVRDLKIIDGVNGPFVAMPSRKLTGHCQRCGHKNHLRAQYCNQCGVKLRMMHDGGDDSPQKLYADVAHPINSACREMIQAAVIEELEEELARAGEPGYRSRYDDEFDTYEAGPAETTKAEWSDQPKSSNQAASNQAASDSTIAPRPSTSLPKPHFDTAKNRKKSQESTGEDFGAGIF